MFRFKGGREYIHGTDFYNETVRQLTQSLPEFKQIKEIAFHAVARKQCTLILERPAPGQKIVVKGSAVTQHQETIGFWWVEDTTEITSRYEFDEDQLTKAAFYYSESQTIEADFENQDYTSIEAVVALTKDLHYRIAGDINGKWLFAQLNLINGMPNNYQKIKIKMLNNIQNKFSICLVAMDDIEIGKIRFIVGEV